MNEISCEISSSKEMGDDCDAEKRGTSHGDSGYASLSGSVDSPDDQPSSNFPAKIEVCQRRLLQRKITKLKLYEKNISSEFLTRFADLKELLGEAFLEHVAHSTKEGSHRPIALDLRMLGTDEESARPWIVVFCEPKLLKRARQFFRQEWVKSHCQPGEARPDVPSMTVFIQSHAPLLAAASRVADVFGDLSVNTFFGDTLCGSVVSVRSQLATVGGIIEVESSIGQSELYGLTVGHILNDPPGLDDLPDITCSSAIQEDDDSEDELFELEIDIDQLLSDPTTTSMDEGVAIQARGDTWPRVGDFVVFHDESDKTIQKPNLDWALVRWSMDSIKPNLISLSPNTSPRTLWSCENIMTNEAHVMLISGFRGKVYGYLSCGDSVLSTSPNRALTSVYIMHPDDRAGTSTLRRSPSIANDDFCRPDAGRVRLLGHRLSIWLRIRSCDSIQCPWRYLCRSYQCHNLRHQAVSQGKDCRTPLDGCLRLCLTASERRR